MKECRYIGSGSGKESQVFRTKKRLGFYEQNERVDIVDRVDRLDRDSKL